MLDVRGGLNYYHNVTATQGNGLTTSTDVGIPGANIDEYTSGISNINIGGHSDPLLGFSASQPWDRSEKTWNATATLTRLLQSHTVKVGGEWRHNERHAAADAGRRRPARPVRRSTRRAPACRASRRRLSGAANAMASFLLDWPNTVQRDLKVFDGPGTKHWAVFLFVQDKWQARSNVTVDLGLRWEYYTPLEGLEGAGSLSNYDPDDPHASRRRATAISDNALNVKKNFKNFAPRTGVSWRLNQTDRACAPATAPARFRSRTTATPSTIR